MKTLRQLLTIFAAAALPIVLWADETETVEFYHEMHIEEGEFSCSDCHTTAKDKDKPELNRELCADCRKALDARVAAARKPVTPRRLTAEHEAAVRRSSSWACCSRPSIR